jgi:hypothetical protein
MSSYTKGFTAARHSENRRDKRLPTPVFAITIGGQECNTINWSLGGLRIGGYDGTLPVGSLVDIEIRSDGPEPELCETIKVKVILVNRAANELAVKFEGMNSKVYAHFERSFSRRFRGNEHNR